MTDKTRQSTFEEASRPLIKWLNDNCHPHVSVIVTNTDAELLESEMCFKTMQYVKD